MNKIKFTILLFCLSFAGIIKAQDYKITTGVVEYQNGEYSNAVSAFEIGLANPQDLKSKNVTKGYYYYGMSLMGELRAAVSNRSEEQIKKFSGNPMKACNSFLKAKDADTDGKWGKKIDSQLNMLKGSLIQVGLESLNGIYKSKDDKEGSKVFMKKGMEALNMVEKIDGKGYLMYDIRGQLLLTGLDSTKAYEDLKVAVDNYLGNKPSPPDFFIGYSIYRKALLERYGQKDVSKALETVQMGIKLLDDEKDRLPAVSETFTEEAKTAKLKTYQASKDDLENFQLDLFLKAPEKLQEALDKFKTACEASPDDYMKHVAYAQMLEKVDMDKAILMYEKAIKIDGNKEIALFNLGAIYTNAAKEKYDLGNEQTDYKLGSQYQEEGNDLLRKAYPHFKKAHELNPNSVTTLSALKQIAITIEDMDAYKLYKEKEAALKK